MFMDTVIMSTRTSYNGSHTSGSPQGVANLVGPVFAGWLYDYSKEWFLTFGLTGLFIGQTTS